MPRGQNSTNSKKDTEISRFGRNVAHTQAENLLNDIKEKAGKVILVTISDRTTIELPAHLSRTERDARVANYIKLHKSKI